MAALRELHQLAAQYDGRLPLFLPSATRVSYLRELGRGSFGTVFEASIQATDGGGSLPGVVEPDGRYAVKTFRRSTKIRFSAEEQQYARLCANTDEALLAAFRNEVHGLLRLAGCPNTVRLLGVGCTDPAQVPSMFLVLNLVAGPTMLEAVQGYAEPHATRARFAGVKYSTTAALRWGAGLAAALAHMHDNLGLLHRDLKLANVGLTTADPDTAEACLLDMGLVEGAVSGVSPTSPVAGRPWKQCGADTSNGLRPIISGRKMRASDSTLGTRNESPCEPPAKLGCRRNTVNALSSGPVELDVCQPAVSFTASAGGSSNWAISGRGSTVGGSVAGRARSRMHQRMPAGTLLYAAPELRLSGVHNTATEVYSLGLLLYELFHRTTIEAVSARSEVAGRGEVGRAIAALRKGWRPDLDDKLCPPAVCAIISRCWSYDPDLRPPVADVRDVLSNQLTQAAKKEKCRSGSSLFGLKAAVRGCLPLRSNQNLATVV